MSRGTGSRIREFDFDIGQVVAEKYQVIEKLGAGWEGEVYRVREINTGIDRAAKVFFPHRNIANKTSKFYARKLHKLRYCPIVIHYHGKERFKFNEREVTMLISEFVEGELLADFLKRQPQKKISQFQAMHLLHALAVGLETIHNEKEYHGDLHSGNIIIRRHGLSFDLKLLDMFHWNFSKRENIQDDICSAVSIFYEALGGRKHYAKQPEQVKYIVAGLKKKLILSRFPRASVLKSYLENMSWD